MRYSEYIRFENKIYKRQNKFVYYNLICKFTPTNNLNKIVMSKDLFQMMREQEVQTSNFLPNKKEIQFSAKKFIESVLEAGETDKFELLAQSKRLLEALETVNAEILKVIPQENFEAFGLKGTFRSGGDTINYSEDEVYADLKSQLAHRESLLKIALTSDIDFYDEQGVKVPKVSTAPRKSSLAITF